MPTLLGSRALGELSHTSIISLNLERWGTFWDIQNFAPRKSRPWPFLDTDGPILESGNRGWFQMLSNAFMTDYNPRQVHFLCDALSRVNVSLNACWIVVDSDRVINQSLSLNVIKNFIPLKKIYEEQNDERQPNQIPPLSFVPVMGNTRDCSRNTVRL